MKTRTTRKLVAMVIALAALTPIWTAWGANRAEAVIAIIRQTGMFSLAPGQATVAHVVNTGTERGFVVKWLVFDSAGNTLAESEVQTVPPGTASAFEYRPAGLAAGQRLAIRVQLRVEGVQGKPSFIATQEVFDPDTIYKTTILLPYIE